MEEKKILTDEELDNVVGGKKAAGYVAVPTCLGVDKNGNALNFDAINNTVYAFKANESGAKADLEIAR